MSGASWDFTVTPPAWGDERMCNSPYEKGGRSLPPGCSLDSPLDSSDHSTYDTEEPQLLGLLDLDGSIGRIRRHQLDPVRLRPVVLHGGLIVDQRHDHFAGDGILLAAHDHVVALENAGARHAVALDA